MYFIWFTVRGPFPGEVCEREVGNCSDAFAVAVKKGAVTVGHVLQNISLICSTFI